MNKMIDTEAYALLNGLRDCRSKGIHKIHIQRQINR